MTAPVELHRTTSGRWEAMCGTAHGHLRSAKLGVRATGVTSCAFPFVLDRRIGCFCASYNNKVQFPFDELREAMGPHLVW